MDRELRSLKRTIKSFDRLNARIKRGTIPSKTGRRMWKSVVLLFSAILLFAVLLPPFRFPTGGAVSSGFFFRRRPESFFALDLEIHKGIDFAAPAGTPVLASSPGIVVETDFGETYGNYVRIRHLFGFETRYAHLNEVNAKEGSLVFLRTLRSIGKVGSTGRSTGPHLHFEVRWFSIALPPRFFLVFHGIREAILGF